MYKAITMFCVAIASCSSSASFKIPLEGIQKNGYEIFYWEKKTLLVVHRSDDVISSLEKPIWEVTTQSKYYSWMTEFARVYGEKIATSAYEAYDISQSKYRSIIPEYFVSFGTSPTSGCSLTVYEDKIEDPCTLKIYDLSGRAIDGGKNIFIPMYSIVDGEIIISPLDHKLNFSPSKEQIEKMEDIDKVFTFLQWNQFDEAVGLIGENISLLTLEGDNGFTPLHILSGKGKLELIEHYLSSVNLNVISDTGITPISFSFLVDQNKSIETLIKYGASKNRVCSKAKGICGKGYSEFVQAVN
jgi:hypothetical protein